MHSFLIIVLKKFSSQAIKETVKFKSFKNRIDVY